METLKMPRQIDSRDLGLQVLVDCESPDVDIVAVHGLGATPSTTWTKAVKQQERAEPKNINWYSNLMMLLPTTGTKAPVQEEKRINWLSDPTMLPALVTNARIMTFNYDSNWYGDDAIKLRLVHVANDLSRELERQRRVRLVKACPLNLIYFQDCSSRRLIFIGHCFGGLVIEKVFYFM
ncbi:and NB-ARC domain-containing protein [Rutstroemia sp. NJR-2017a WRK4]|nr:and NB-ARC domain-containing protein [Rutstroemia sp. NJR-2017a WRK4]